MPLFRKRKALLRSWHPTLCFGAASNRLVDDGAAIFVRRCRRTSRLATAVSDAAATPPAEVGGAAAYRSNISPIRIRLDRRRDALLY